MSFPRERFWCEILNKAPPSDYLEHILRFLNAFLKEQKHDVSNDGYGGKDVKQYETISQNNGN